MIIEKLIEVNGRTLISHESDCGKMICQVETGIEYSSAVDELPCKYTYTEIDIPTNEDGYYEITEEEYTEILNKEEISE